MDENIIYAYKQSVEICPKDYDFMSLIMASMRKADSDNLEKLKSIFPDEWNNLKICYNLPLWQ